MANCWFPQGTFRHTSDPSMAQRSKVLDEKALYYGHLKNVTACAELIKPDANKCRFCGTELDNYEPIIEINPDESADKQNT